MRAKTTVALGASLLVVATLVAVLADGQTPQTATIGRRDTVRIFPRPDTTPTTGADTGRRTLQAQVGHPEGFGAGTTGGAGGRTAWVTSLEDSGPGSLREAIDAGGPVWVRFAVSGEIVLHSSLQLPSNVTIDGRDQRVEIAVDQNVTGIEIGEVENIIIHNLVFTGGEATINTPQEPRADAITIIGGKRIWIDHNTMTGWGDKLIGMPVASGVTISYNHLFDHEECVLIGVRSLPEGARSSRVTLHHNYFDACASRSPRVGDGAWAHVYNNLVTAWRFYGIAAVREAQLHSEHNVFVPDDEERAIVNDNGPGGPGFVRSSCDLTQRDARILVNEPARVFDPTEHYEVGMHAASPALAEYLRARAGWQSAQAAGREAPEPARAEPCPSSLGEADATG